MNNYQYSLGIILFAHGSRDTLWSTPIEAIARHLIQNNPTIAVRCAYLEWTSPDLSSAMAELAKIHVTRVRIVPLFLGIGKHAREDIPKLVQTVQSEFPEIALELRPSVGEHPSLHSCIGNIALESLMPSNEH